MEKSHIIYQGQSMDKNKYNEKFKIQTIEKNTTNYLHIIYTPGLRIWKCNMG